MTTESDLPRLVITVQLSRRGDFLCTIEESASVFRPPEPHQLHWWALADDLWRELRREVPVAVATWVHRLRRGDADPDHGLPVLRD